jgi:5-methylcytosine-specific restriction enzyme B
MGIFSVAVSDFSYPDEQHLDKLRQEFVEKFPISELPRLKLEEYALGIDRKENTFCWWLEFKTSDVGHIGGATAMKHGIYFSRDEQKWKFDSRYTSKEEAFEAVRSGIIRLVELAGREEYDKLDSVEPFEHQNLTRGKILFMYHPDKFLPVFSIENLKDFCVQFGVDANFESQSSMNTALVAFKKRNPEVANWSNQKFMKLLYDKFSPKVQFWKIAPGEKAAFWTECRDGGFICVGWAELDDMRQYTEESAFKEKYRSIYGAQRVRQWREIWNFSKEVKKGDIVVANNGLSEIVGIGTVIGDYRYDPQRSYYKHCLPVRWNITTAFPVPEPALPITSNWFQGTIKKLGREEYQKIVAGANATSYPVWRRSGDYDLILTNPAALNADEAKSLFRQVLDAEFGSISQHVREDLRHWLDNTDSVLPSEAYVTLSNWFLSSPIYTQTDRAKSATKLWDLLFAQRPERLSDPERNTKIIPAAFESWWTKMKAVGAAVDTHVSAVTPASPATPLDDRYAQVCHETFMPEEFFRNCERLLYSKKQIILQGAPGTGKTFIAEKLAALWAGDSKRVKIVQFHESFGYEDFIYGIKPRVGVDGKTAFCPEPGLFLRFCEDEIRKGAPDQNFVLLIDEINRAKTARVFGELLFLLEYRDRKVELQNGREFSIPPNLYIIGTMNTTDKSIALVDYALRRRFAFIDLLPVKNGASVVLRKWLDTNDITNAAEVDALFLALNKAIAQKDEGLMVGHSYFMQKDAITLKRFSDEMLHFLWEYYILPLVAEYEYQLSRSELEERYGLNALRSVTTNVAIV